VAKPVTMPQLGETVVEGTIVKWLKSEGDTVERDEPLFEISTDKVDTEVPSPLAGTIKEIKVQEGETVEVGTELAVIDEGGGDGQAAAAEGEAEAEAPTEEKAEPQPDEEAEPQPEEEEAEAAREEAPSEREEQEPAPQQAQAAEGKTEEAVKAETRGGDGQAQPGRGGDGQQAPSGGPRSHILSPLVRRLAEEHDVDLSQVQGSGAGGRITKKDIMAFVESGGAAARPEAERPQLRAVPSEEKQAPPERAPAAGEREEVVQLTHIRKRIAQNMVAVLQSTARAWNMVEVNFEDIVQLRNRAKGRFKQEEGFSLTFMPFLGRALCDALAAFPDVNARLDLDAGTATYRRYVNLGVAVAYEDGLIVPVVRGADEMNLVGLARAVNDVATRARSKKLKPDEVHGGTFTITNPGPFGSVLSVPIMNPGETAILAFDAIEKRPVVIDDAIAIRHMCYLSMSWDHRTIDGATAAQFLGRLKQNLETWDFTPEVQAYLE
jgi:pyruvate dehydrogenase E2 component (dihydrolipoyllysine-residue acetyltransferase)